MIPVTKRDILIGGIALAIGAAAASELTFLWTKSRIRTSLEKVYEERLRSETEATREHYKIMAKADEYATPLSAAEAMGTPLPPEIVAEKNEPVAYEKMAKPQTVVVNVFDIHGDEHSKDAFDLELEKVKRSNSPTGTPYILSWEEYLENDQEYEQLRITYFDEDDCYVNEDDELLTSAADSVGAPANLQFGYGSNDPEVVFVCNPRLNMMFEITRGKGSYAEAVHGFIQHSDDRPRVRKFRQHRD